MKNTFTPCIWFDNNAQEAAEFYVDIFPNGKLLDSNPVMTQFELMGMPFLGLNGGAMFRPNPSISFFVETLNEDEIDAIWAKLSVNANVLMPLNAYPWSPKYGWLQDKYGVCWVLLLLKEASGLDAISPSLMFTGKQNGKAIQAIEFYTSVFKSDYEPSIARYEKGENDTEGNIKYAHFKLLDSTVKCIESSMMHKFSFTEGVSLVLNCDTQAEIDYYWDALISNGGEESQCGWLKDQFGVSWQVVPTKLGEWMSDPEKGQKVIQAFMKMKKFDIEILQNL